MKKLLLLLFLSFLIFNSCSNDNIEQSDENSKLTPSLNLVSKSSNLVSAPPPEGCGNVIQVGAPDGLYNCFGLAFSVSETGYKTTFEESGTSTWYATYIASGLFKEVNINEEASKVLYWNDEALFDLRDPVGIDHAAIIVGGTGDGRTVRSKEGGDELNENCIKHYYLEQPEITDAYDNFSVYALDLTLTMDPLVPSPTAGQSFTLSAPADGGALGVTYSWEVSPEDLDKVDFKPLSDKNKYQAEFIVNNDPACGQATIKLIATHQTHEVGDGANTNSYPVTVEGTFKFVPEECPIDPSPFTCPNISATGPTYMGARTNFVTWNYAGDIPESDIQAIKWWYKKINSVGEPFVISYSTGTSASFFAVADTFYSDTGNKTSDFKIYLEVITNDNESCISSEYIITKKGKYKLEGF